MAITKANVMIAFEAFINSAQSAGFNTDGWTAVESHGSWELFREEEESGGRVNTEFDRFLGNSRKEAYNSLRVMSRTIVAFKALQNSKPLD